MSSEKAISRLPTHIRHIIYRAHERLKWAGQTKPRDKRGSFALRFQVYKTADTATDITY